MPGRTGGRWSRRSARGCERISEDVRSLLPKTSSARHERSAVRNSPICVDASLLVRLVADPDDAEVQRLWQVWQAEGREFHAPTLMLYEVTNAFYQYERRRVMDASDARLAIESVLLLPVRLHGDAVLHHAGLQLAEQFGLPAAYDAHYLAPAQRLGAEL